MKKLSKTNQNNEPFYTTNTKEIIKVNELSILLLYFNEITQNRVTLVNTEAIIHKTLPLKQACSFWNTYYVYSFGGNQSVSETNVDQEAAYEIVTGELGGCSKIGGINTSCAWGQHMCLSSQAVCCN
ncbi:hypothetical protein F7018_01125 [Tenacibaculum aiptasiae]|uniref:Uncharacterized protein n=1 Tax=Tenacibaculum aiptasiae TaxID=426481 RepID=A0A7J5AS97_9FLAO|nr:hypothetical protein [Tenacibaculum aiptasiae]KAB1160506.1 hypothetical protein F7018_01125 [Tenacibaculum aiptasiae]